MSRQSVIHEYFKLNKGSASPCLTKSAMKSDEDVKRKRKLSLKKCLTPSKSPKVKDKSAVGDSSHIGITSSSATTVAVQNVKVNNEKDKPTSVTQNFTTSRVSYTSQPLRIEDEVIDLCSDDERPSSTDAALAENGDVNEEKAMVDLLDSFCSPTYTQTTTGTPTTPKSVLRSSHTSSDLQNENNGHESDSSQDTIIYSPPPTPLTPRRSPQTPASSFRSPNSANKYFSPNKKRAIFIKKPVRRNLTQSMADCERNDLFDNACLGLDDKTIFLLTIINKCINKPSLFKLLNEKSQNLLSSSMHILKPGMRLVCRLYWHKKGWYKMDKIKSLLSGTNGVIDDPTMHHALNSLQTNNFLDSSASEGNTISFDEFTTILSSEDLKEICKGLKLKINSKQGAIAALKSYSKAKSISNFYTQNKDNNATRVLKIMSTKAGPLYKLSDIARRTLYELYILMYLGINYDLIRESKLELTLLYDKTQVETYPVEDQMLDDASIVFRDRKQFERYVIAHTDYEEYLIESDADKRCEIVTKTFDNFKNIPQDEMLWCESLPIWLRRFTPMHFYVKILEAGVQDLKKATRHGLALEVLQALISQQLCRQHKRTEWYAEKALVLHKCSRLEEAAKVLLEGFKSDIDDEAKDKMRPRALKFAKQKGLALDDKIRAELLEYATKEDILENTLRGVHVYKQPMERTSQKGKLKFETRAAGERSVLDVEEYCLAHYLSSGDFTHGLHCEGRLITTMFYLLFWDIIYSKPASCAGVFLSRFQSRPLDMFCGFYDNRRDSVDARLGLIERCTSDELVEIMRTKWEETEQSSVHRGVVRWESVCAVGLRLAPAALAALCRRLAARPANTAGFPDLTLWSTDTNKVRFVEVKSDTDRPSLRQLQWMHFLQRVGLDAEFCYVGVNTTRCRARPAPHANT